MTLLYTQIIVFITKLYRLKVLYNNKMSIYSGFATRHQQQLYDNLLLDLISVLQRRIIKFYTGEEADEIKFHQILNNIHHHLSKMEESKYLEPKMANSFSDLIQLTSNVSSQAQKEPQISREDKPKQAWMQKQSLNLSAQKLSNMKSFNIGRIRHQSTSKQKQEASSRGQSNPSNPQFTHDKNIKHFANQLNKSGSRTKRDLHKWGAMFDQNINALEEKKNIQYIIREYVSRGQQRRKYKRKIADY